MPHPASRYALTFVALPLFCLAIATGCASLTERGQEALEAGNYEVAARYYEQALARSPDDAVASAGLKQARGEILSQRLLGVRNARMAGNTGEALDLLRGIVELEAQWKLSPGGKVAFTQEEEQGFAKTYFVQRIDADLSTQYPLRASVALKKYANIFEPAFISGLENKVNRRGKESCRRFKKEVTSGKPFFALFVANYCRFWGDTGKVGAGKEILSDQLFGRIELKNDSGSSTFHGMNFLSAEVSKALAKSAWYDPDGKLIAQATLSADFQSQKDKQGLILVQPYKEQEAYVENVAVTKYRRVEYQETVRSVDPRTMLPVETVVTKYRDEPYETVEAQKKHRVVEKQYRYPAWKHTQNLSLQLSGQFSFGSRSFPVALSEKSNIEGIEHDENQPNYGLQPSRPNLPDPARWTQEQSARFAQSFLEHANQLWADSYCRMNTEVDSLAENGNQVELCLRSKPVQAPKFADDWYRKFLGLGYAEAVTVLGSSGK